MCKLRLGGVWLLSALSLFGQSLASLSGTVSDPTGAVVPTAAITLVETSTGLQRETVSDESGRYSFAQLKPGKYKVTAKAKGFDPVDIDNVELLVNTPATLPITFARVGSVSETVAVAAEGVQVNSTDASIGNAVAEREITQLPFEARNIVGLLALQPGVTYLGDPNAGSAPDYRSGAVNGGKSDQATITLDGINVEDQQNRYAFTSVLRVTLDSVQEFRTITSNSGAEFGRTSGAQVALVTKSGTNDLHGSAYEYHRNTLTSANTFFNNAAGVDRPKLIRNIFGASAGGPILKNRLFIFGNYEGRRDRSDTPALSTVVGAAGTKIVPTASFRQGIYQYRRTDGSVGTLSPDQVKALDPAGIGESPAVLQALQSYPLPNDFSVGDNLNTAGFRFNAPTPLRWNTYIARVDYQVDSTGNHRLFWRGNLQNDNFQNGLPQFPGDPASSVLLDNSKGIAAGYTAVLRPTLVSTLRYGYTRQGTENTGILTAPFVEFRDIEPLHSTSRGLSRVIPLHEISEDMSWMKGAHNIAFGAVARFIRNNRLDFDNAFSNALTNSAYLVSSGSDLLPADAQNTTVAKEQMVNLLGLLTQVTGQYNYDIKGNLLPQGAGIRRTFAEQDYEIYGQDTWRATRGLTVTAGLRLSLRPPVYEANGAQTSTNIPLSDWFNQRGALAAAGQPQSLAPKISYQLAGAAGGHSLYDYQKDFAPRLAVAYSPQSDSGWRGKLFGGPGKTAIRAGWGLYYDLFGQGLLRSYDSTALGFATSITPPPSPDSPTGNAATAPRFTGFYSLPASILPPPPPGGFPQVAPDNYSVTGGLDEKLKAPYSISMDFSIGREFAHGFYVQGAYVGRLSRHSLIRDDLAMPTNLRDPASGQTYFQAAQILSRAGRNGLAPNQIGPIPFWENIFPGYADGTRTATQAIYEDYFLGAVTGGSLIGNESTALQLLDTSGCSPCSKFGPYAFFSSQYASLAAFRSRGTGSYHAMQWTVRKRFAQGISFDLNYTFSKSIDLGSTVEADPLFNAGQIQNAWFPNQMRGVSDYDVTHLVSALWVAELPFGKGKKFLGRASGVLDALVGGWQLSGLWRQSSGLPIFVQNGFNWPTNWQVSPFATLVGTKPATGTSKNAPASGPGGVGGANIFPDPAGALAAFDTTLPGESGNRNILRGDGYFTIDAGLGKRFTLFTVRDHPHTLQFRAEAFNLTNSVRFDVGTINLTLGDTTNFGKYTDVLTKPRVMQFSMRYEF